MIMLQNGTLISTFNRTTMLVWQVI